MTRETKHSGNLILYRRSFPLANGSTFSHYVKTLDKKVFHPYTLLIENLYPIEGYSIEILYVPDIFQPGFGLVDPILRPVLLNKCNMKYSEKKKEITLEAYPDSEGSLPAIVLWSLFAIVMTFVLIDISVLFPILMTLIVIFMAFAIYRRDVRRYEVIGSIAMES